VVSGLDLAVSRTWAYVRELENIGAGTIDMDRRIRMPPRNLEVTFIPGTN
jgi:hypothetical protein